MVFCGSQVQCRDPDGVFERRLRAVVPPFVFGVLQQVVEPCV